MKRNLWRVVFGLLTAACLLTFANPAAGQTPLTITCPTNQTVWTCTTNAVRVTFPSPTVAGSCASSAVITCNPASGSFFPLGTNTVVCIATDNCRETATCSFRIAILRDVTPPLVQCPTNITVFSCNRSVPVSYPLPPATDDHDPKPNVECDPPSGSFFPVGTNTVVCTAVDDCTNRARCIFSVIVNQDSTPPTIECPSNIVVWTCGTSPVPVSFPAPTADDDHSQTVDIQCTPPSESPFPLGTNSVTCRATDDCGNRSECTFDVIVRQDTLPPIIECPIDRSVCGCSTAGMAVAYLTPQAADDADDDVDVNCLPPSGSVFPVGTNTVICTAEDDCNHRTECSFKVIVNRDTTPPVIECPTNIVIVTCNLNGAVPPVVPPGAHAEDDCDGYPEVTCNPKFPSVFPIGKTTVHCAAVDNCGNRSTCSFTVTVIADTSVPGTDVDQNGLSDIWQIAFGTGTFNPNDDSDGDGMTNGEEAIAGTDPRNAEGHVNWYPTTYNHPIYTLSWPSVAGKSYRIRATPDLGMPFFDFSPPLFSRGGRMSWSFSVEDRTIPEAFRSQGFFQLAVQDVDTDGDGITAWEEGIIGTSDLTPNTHGTPGGDHGAANKYAQENGTGPGRLREVAAAHVGGSPQGPTTTKLLTASGTGGFFKLSSWNVDGGGQLAHLQDTAVLEGHHIKLHTLSPPLSPNLTLNLVVSARIREDDNLWLTVYRVGANGSLTALSTLGFGSNVGAEVIDYALAHRAFLDANDAVDRFQIVTPVVARIGNDNHLRVLTWTVDPNTGALGATHDSGDVGNADVPAGGTQIQATHLRNNLFVVSYSNSGNNLSSWFFETSGAGWVFERGGQASGLDLRGTADVEVTADQFALSALGPTGAGFTTAVLGENCEIKLMVWEDRIVTCIDPCISKPYLIADNTLDQKPNDHGVVLPPPQVTDSRQDDAEAFDLFGDALAIADFNGDGYDDVAIGVPGEDFGDVQSAGAVNIMFGSANGLRGSRIDEVWTQDSDGVTSDPEPGDSFGYSLAAGDFNGDGYADLAIGIPGEGLNNNAIPFGGGVQILRGSIFGLVATGNNLFWSQDTDGIVGEPEPGDRFGDSLAAGDFNGDGYDDLAIGIPVEDIEAASADDAGAVNIIYGSVNGLSAAGGPGNEILHQDISYMADFAETGDRFGFCLSAGDFNGDGRDDLAIGVPYESVNGVEAAGAVQIVYGSANGFGPKNDVASQAGLIPALTQIQGEAQEFDLLGWSVAAGDFNDDGIDDLAFGVPYEDLENDGISWAGAVHVLYGTPQGLTATGNQLITQNGIQPGGAQIQDLSEDLDHFGWALAAGNFDGQSGDDLAISAPRESLTTDSIAQAGVIHVIYGSGTGLIGAGNQLFVQGDDIGGTPETNDRFGLALAAGDLNGDGRSDLVIGSPEEDVGDTIDGGSIQVIYGDDDNSGLTTDGDQVWTQGVERRVRALLVDKRWEETYGPGARKLFEKVPPNELTNVHVASVTKTMTLLLAVKLLEIPALDLSLTNEVTISQLAAETGGSIMEPPDGPELEKDDKMPLDLLLNGMMQRSCNRSSVAIAEYLATVWYDHIHPGPIPQDFDACAYFVTNMMQQTAQDLGMVNTIYGHPAGGCITTGHDLTLLWRDGWQYQLFRGISTAKDYAGVGEDVQGNPKVYLLEKHSDGGGYPGLEGWKGGNGGLWKGAQPFVVPWCTESVLGQATRLDRSLIFVLQQTKDRWVDAKPMLDYGFQYLFTPDFRGGHQMNGPTVVDFAVRRITDTMAFSAIIDTQNNLRLHTWQVVAGIGQVAPLGNAFITYDNLGAGTHAIEATLIDMTKLPTVEAESDYLTGHVESGRLRLDVWRVGAEPGN